MDTLAAEMYHEAAHPVDVRLAPSLEDRNRLTTGFRMILAIPHLLLVGAPIAATFPWSWGSENGWNYSVGAGGALGAAAGIAALIAWFAILFTGRYPEGLRNLVTFYLRWRVRAVAYAALLRDEYPPFGEGDYPAGLELSPPDAVRNRLSVGFRLILAIPHLVVTALLNIAWGLTTIFAWFAILFTGRYPEGLYDFGTGVFRWNTRVEAYLLLLHDDYPPFALH